MAVTETIQELLQGIDDAQYGRDMRQYIHKGIQKCYEEGSAGATDLIARETIENLGNAYSIPTSITTGSSSVPADCQLIVIPGTSMMQLCVHINNTQSSDFALQSINYVTKLPIPYKTAYFGLYKWDSLTSSGFDGAPVVVCRLVRANASNSQSAPYTQGCLMMQGVIPAGKNVYGSITIPYYALHPDHPISSGTLIDASTDWDA